MTYEEYWRALRSALRNLYDPAALRRSPLSELLATAGMNRPLQETLLEAVQALSPAQGTAVHSDARRIHHILQHRYVEQFSQSEVADSLGLSARQLRRQEQMAIRALGETLRAQYALPLEPASQDAESLENAGEEFDEIDSDEIEGEAKAELRLIASQAMPETYQDDLAWITQSAPQASLDIDAMLADALQTLHPLLAELRITTRLHSSPALPRVDGNAMALRQALVITLSAVARSAAGGTVAIGINVVGTALEIRLSSEGNATTAMRGEGEDIVMARRLLALSKARLEIDEVGVTLSLPIGSESTVLVIDDNQDSLLLIQRYLTGTRYRLLTTRDPAEGIALALREAPATILLDVMMPEIDGWGVLTQLRSEEKTRATPIVICTILPEGQLAAALGASGFLRKPIAREELLRVLEEFA